MIQAYKSNVNKIKWTNKKSTHTSSDLKDDGEAIIVWLIRYALPTSNSIRKARKHTIHQLFEWSGENVLSVHVGTSGFSFWRRGKIRGLFIYDYCCSCCFYSLCLSLYVCICTFCALCVLPFIVFSFLCRAEQYFFFFLFEFSSYSSLLAAI